MSEQTNEASQQNETVGREYRIVMDDRTTRYLVSSLNFLSATAIDKERSEMIDRVVRQIMKDKERFDKAPPQLDQPS